eukprot:349593-Rhodomonas_salina.2
MAVWIWCTELAVDAVDSEGGGGTALAYGSADTRVWSTELASDGVDTGYVVLGPRMAVCKVCEFDTECGRY